MNQQTGKYIIVAGIAVVIIGILVYFFHNKLNWFGRLPGDISVKKERFSFYFPVVSMILLSLLLSLIINLFRKF